MRHAKGKPAAGHLNYKKHKRDISIPIGIKEVMFTDILRMKNSS